MDVSHMLSRLPDDLVERIRTMAVDDVHLLARLLLRRAASALHRAASSADTGDVRAEMVCARSAWSSIMRLRCWDATIVRDSRRHHDLWLQLLEDPYEMRFGMWRVLAEFQETFACVLWNCSRSVR